MAMKLDTRLANTLKTLPIPDPAPENNLAFRNLLRANMVKLATGQQMVTFLQGKGIALTQLTPARIRDGNGGASLANLTAAQKQALVTNTPLWFYILREAEFNNGKLGPVGSRIVAETFHRAIQGSTFSIVRDTSIPPLTRAEQHHLPDGRPAALCLQRTSQPAATRTARNTPAQAEAEVQFIQPHPAPGARITGT